MQILKDELRLSILQTAKESFLLHGFDKTSMKDIAIKLGVSVGNLYRYYPNKEALFDAIVIPAYEGFTGLINKHEVTADEPISILSILEQLGTILSELLLTHRESLLILLYGSKGTKHEAAKEQLFTALSEHMQDHVKSYNHRQIDGNGTFERLSTEADTNKSHEPSTTLLDLQVARPIAISFLEGYFEIIRLHADPERIHSLTKQYVTIWFMGLKHLM